MMRRKVFLAMGIAAAMLVSSCGGADAPSSLPPSSVEVMEGSSPSPSVVPVAKDHYYYGVLKVQETTEKGLPDFGLRWMLGSPVCGEEGCTWAWEDVTGEWTISGSLTINADGSVSGRGDGWWVFSCDGEQRMSSVQLSGSATPSAIGSAPTSLSLTVVEEGANPGTCGPLRNIYEFDATSESLTETESSTETGSTTEAARGTFSCMHVAADGSFEGALDVELEDGTVVEASLGVDGASMGDIIRGEMELERAGPNAPWTIVQITRSPKGEKEGKAWVRLC